MCTPGSDLQLRDAPFVLENVFFFLFLVHLYVFNAGYSGHHSCPRGHKPPTGVVGNQTPHESSWIHQKSPGLVKSNPNVNVCARVIFFSYRCRDVLATLWKHQKRLKQKKPVCLWEPDGLLSHCVSRVFGPRWSLQSGTALRTLA